MRRTLTMVAAVAFAIALAFGGVVSAQSSNAANKVTVSGATMDIFTFPQTILSTSLKTSTNADLILQVTAECAIAIDDSDQSFQGGDFADNALAIVRVWVTVDGSFVPVAAGDPDGKVTFCRRQRDDNSFNQGGNFTVREFNASRDANSFNWVARNVGNGTHAVAVHAEVLATSSSSPAPFSFSGFTFGNPTPTVQGVVGRRTLVIEPVLPAK